MKKNDWILIISVILYSFLFYNQFAGVNFLIFNIALIIGLLLKERELVKNKKWKLSAFLSLGTSLAITIYGNGLAVFANVIALSLLSAFSLRNNNSFLISLAFSFYSYATSVFYMVLDWQKRANSEATKSVPSVKRTFLIIIPVLITIFFLFLYRASNPLFNDFIKKINLDFISFELIFFTIFGFILLYGFYYHRKINLISAIDENSKQSISAGASESTLIFGKSLSQSDELFSGKLLFVLLNILVLIINILDFDFLFISHHLPEDVTYSQFVHQGIGALIFSIVMSVLIILFYFRGGINFSKDNKLIKPLAYLWIIQNLIMLISTSMRNGMYINEYGLTYKRIGVFIYLLLTTIGLITTSIKIAKYKTASFLIRINSWLFYFVLVISCFVNWDMFITNYNIKHSGKVSKDYLVMLSETNLPELFKLEKEDVKLMKSVIGDSVTDAQRYYEGQLGTKLFEFMKQDKQMDWRSWNYDHSQVKNDLIDLNSRSEIPRVRLVEKGLYDLNVIKEFWNLTDLDVQSNYIRSVSEIKFFPGLVKLDLSWNRISRLEGIDNLQKLEYLNLRGNPITDYSPLLKLNNLKELHLPINISNAQVDSLKLRFPDLILVKY
ncbi:MAG: DUF4173 domain-containing protein [Bacteroidetes bacterium]|nr:DUF4173 domain-containing protein [Bacteroidota bacterium]MBL0033081.1 DUF4173 domain-containing protein [Bacteroidota bacterium]MBP6656438.1 DUF4173 domain-containing protein [Bacteroidia bacterium]